MIRWPAPGPYVVAFPTRRGGVSVGPYASLNLGRMTQDEPDRVEENRRRLLAQLGADPTRLALNRQVHGATVNLAREGSRGELGDGLWTAEPGVPLLAIAADCLPIALVRTDAVAVGVLHAGWRGLLAGIAEAGVTALGGSVAACLGPSIGPCCYWVGEEVAGPFRTAYGDDVAPDGRLDLWTAAERALRAAGATAVERLDVCTSCNPTDFFSHRRDGGVTGRQGVVALVA